MPDNIEDLEGFFDYVWQDTHGYVYLPTIHKGQQVTKYMWEWPRQKKAVIKHVIMQDSLGNDVFYSPAIYKEPVPEKDYVQETHVLWVDMDGNAPEDWEAVAKKHDIPAPTFTIASSVEGREHAYWRLAAPISDIETIDSRNRALTYTLGADSSGWDANQFLRPPFTKNYGHKTGGGTKEWFSGDAVDVRLSRFSDVRVNPNAFNPLGTPEHIITSRISLGDLPSLSDVFMAGHWPEDFRTVFNYSKDEAAAASPEGRSGTLSRLGYYGAENGFSDESIFVILRDADDRWEKYTGRRNRDDYLLDIIGRARAKHGYVDAGDITLRGLLQGAGSASPIVNSKLGYSFTEFMELDIQVDWFLDGLLRNEGVGVLTGEPGVGKSQAGIQLLAHMALGRDFLGWTNHCGPKKVVFASFEMESIPLKIFWESISPGYKRDYLELGKNFTVVPLGEGVPVDKPGGQRLFEEILTTFKPDVVVIDSLQKITSKPLTDEISVKQMLEFMDQMRIKHHVAIIFIHHNRKKNGDSSSAVELDDMYGSRYIAANVDFVLNLRELTKDVLAIDHTKNRLGKKRDSFEVTRNEYLQFELGTERMIPKGIMNGQSGFGFISPSADDGRGSGGLFGLT